MFGFLDMAGNYEDRKVDRYESKDGSLTVSTAKVTDSRYPFETAVSHPSYNDSRWVIVESYNSRAEAVAGHKKWVKTMTSSKLPKELKDVMTSDIASLLQAVGGEDTFKKCTAKKRSKR